MRSLEELKILIQSIGWCLVSAAQTKDVWLSVDYLVFVWLWLNKSHTRPLFTDKTSTILTAPCQDDSAQTSRLNHPTLSSTLAHPRFRFIKCRVILELLTAGVWLEVWNLQEIRECNGSFSGAVESHPHVVCFCVVTADVNCEQFPF